jgi:transposase
MTNTILEHPAERRLRAALVDLERTRAELSQSHERIHVIEDENGALRKERDDLLARVNRLERDNADLRRQLYQPSSERHPLSPDPSKTGPPEAPTSPQETSRAPPSPSEGAPQKPPRKAAPHGRAALPEHLPEIPFPVELEGEARCPDCGGPCHPFAEDELRVLDLAPSPLRVLRMTRKRWSCPKCQTNVLRPDWPLPLPRTRATARLLAHVATAKFADHLPHYRLHGIFLRQGLKISRSTLSDWNHAIAQQLLKRVVEAIEDDVLANDHIGLDDTDLATRDPAHPKNINRRARLWLYRGARGDCVLKYAPDKGGRWPAEMLKDFQGTVQADAANSFDQLFKDGTKVEAGCNAHARRKYVKVKELPEVRPILKGYEALYELEAEAKRLGLSHQARREFRQTRSLPAMDDLYAKIHALKPAPGTQLATAVGYSLNHEKALRRFLDDGRLEIDNNAVERLFRLVALGRRNWFFAGSPRGAEDDAILYSIVASCRDLKIDPFEYLTDILSRIPSLPASRLKEITPRRWLEARR